MGWRTAETPSRTGTFSTQSDRLDGTLGGTVSASLKGERPGWLSPAVSAPPPRHGPPRGGPSKAVPRGWQRDRSPSSVQVHSSRGPC